MQTARCEHVQVLWSATRRSENMRNPLANAKIVQLGNRNVLFNTYESESCSSMDILLRLSLPVQARSNMRISRISYFFFSYSDPRAIGVLGAPLYGSDFNFTFLTRASAGWGTRENNSCAQKSNRSRASESGRRLERPQEAHRLRACDDNAAKLCLRCKIGHNAIAACRIRGRGRLGSRKASF